MARLARVVVPGVGHHVTQRGNRRQQTFFNDEDYGAYLELLGDWCGRCGVEVWAYCLMPNHVHLIVVPDSEDGLRLALGEAHRRYTRRINFRGAGSRLHYSLFCGRGIFAGIPNIHSASPRPGVGVTPAHITNRGYVIGDFDRRASGYLIHFGLASSVICGDDPLRLSRVRGRAGRERPGRGRGGDGA